MNEIYYKPIPTLWGTAYVIFFQDNILEFILPGRKKSLNSLYNLFSQKASWLDQFIKDISKYFQGKPVIFSCKIDLSGYTSFEKKVLTVLQKIKYGKTISYKELAEKIGHLNAYRAVGRVMAKNKTPLLIPCHRVIKNSGEPGYFSYGINYKIRLLKLEKIIYTEKKRQVMKKQIYYLSLGTNIGNKKTNLEKAIRLLKNNAIDILKQSSIYKTEPIGIKNQADFYNQVLKCRSVYEPDELLNIIMRIEKSIGRKKTIRWGPRIIDIDILLYGNSIIRRKNLVIPHPELHNRNFILIPLQEIDQQLTHPLLHIRLKDLVTEHKGTVVKL